MKSSAMSRSESGGLVAAGKSASGNTLARGWRRLVQALDRSAKPSLSHLPAAVAAEVRAAQAPVPRRVGAPATLKELGVPGPLAAEMEIVMGLMSQSETGRFLGYTFCTPDGVLHRLRREVDDDARGQAA